MGYNTIAKTDTLIQAWFWGLANWYGTYIKGHAKYAGSLTDALKGTYHFGDRDVSEGDGSGRDGNNLPLKLKKTCAFVSQAGSH